MRNDRSIKRKVIIGRWRSSRSVRTLRNVEKGKRRTNVLGSFFETETWRIASHDLQMCYLDAVHVSNESFYVEKMVESALRRDTNLSKISRVSTESRTIERRRDALGVRLLQIIEVLHNLIVVHA